MMVRRACWTAVPGPLPGGVLARHTTVVLGLACQAELVLAGTGALMIRVNGQPYGDLLIETTFRQGKRHYQRALREIGAVRQSRLPL